VCSPGGTCVSSTTEDCMNGIDDDGNGMVDCADPACSAGYRCVPQVPSGFTGPGEVFDGPGPSPPCDQLYPKESLDGWATPQCPTSCGPCTCGSPTGVTCGNPSVASGVESCPKPPTPLPPGTCTPATFAAGSMFATFAGTASTSGGSCPGLGGTVPPITWNKGHLCTANVEGGKGCAVGYVCWPKPQPPFLPQACVFAHDDQTCPSTGYTVKRNYYGTQDVHDTRVCSTCACNAPSGGTCAATLGMWTKASIGTTSCATPSLITYTVPSLCQTVPNNIGAVMFTSKGYTGGSCTPSGPATLTGTCTPSGTQTTACCTPP
jgi:hypothetical protein